MTTRPALLAQPALLPSMTPAPAALLSRPVPAPLDRPSPTPPAKVVPESKKPDGRVWSAGGITMTNDTGLAARLTRTGFGLLVTDDCQFWLCTPIGATRMLPSTFKYLTSARHVGLFHVERGVAECLFEAQYEAVLKGERWEE